MEPLRLLKKDGKRPEGTSLDSGDGNYFKSDGEGGDFFL